MMRQFVSALCFSLAATAVLAQGVAPDVQVKNITSEVLGIIKADKDITLDAGKGKILLNAKEVEIVSTTGIKVESGSEMNLKASATVTLKGATVNIN